MASELGFLLLGGLLVVVAGSTKGSYGNMMLPLLALGLFLLLSAVGFLPIAPQTTLVIVFMLAFGFVALARIRTVSLAATAIKFGLVFYIVMAMVRGI